MSFIITIIEKRSVLELVQPEYQKIGTKEEERESRFFSDDPKEPKTRIADVWGYPPKVEKIVTKDRELLKQEVETLDLNLVITAINKL